jgi:hypothetical protein
MSEDCKHKNIDSNTCKDCAKKFTPKELTTFYNELRGNPEAKEYHIENSTLYADD